MRPITSFFCLAALLLTTGSAQPSGLRLTLTDPAPDRLRQVFTSQPAIRFHGSAADASGSVEVHWESHFGFMDKAAVEIDRAQPSQARWNTRPIPLHPGPNRIKLRAADESKRYAESIVTVYYTPAPQPAAPPAEVRSGIFRGKPIHYQVIGGRAVYQGDILLPEGELDPAGPLPPGTRSGVSPRPHSAPVANAASLWPVSGGAAHVPYRISSDTQGSATAVANINAGVSNFNSTFPGVIQWVPWSGETNSVMFDLAVDDHSGSCSSSVGMAGDTQRVTGSIDCVGNVLLHEMGHAVGLWHEQSRLDRDGYVSILYGNIDKPSAFNFDRSAYNEVDLGYYDYASLMHYQARLFSKYGTAPTIETIPAGLVLSGAGFSPGDIDAVRRLYQHAPTAVTIVTNPPGGQALVDGVLVNTPQTFNWAVNSIHTLDVPAGQQVFEGRLAVFGRWSDAAPGTQNHTITVSPGVGTPYSPASGPARTVYTANFIPLYEFSFAPFSSGGTASVNPSPSISISGHNYFINRQQVTLQASPAAGFGFNFWANLSAFNFYANPNTFYVESDLVAATPLFQTAPVLTLATSAAGIPPSGLYPSLALVVDGSPTYTPTNLLWRNVLQVGAASLDSSPVTGNIRYAFSNWSDGGAAEHSVSAPVDTSNRTLTANYIPSFRSIASPLPACGGSVFPNQDSFLQYGTQLSFVPISNPGLAFVGWGGDLAGGANAVTVTDQILATAYFNVSGTTAPLAITSFSPASLPSSAGAFDLVVNGTGFTGGTYAFWGSGFRNTTFNSPTQITVHLSAGDLAAPGYFQLQVVNSSGGCSPYAIATYTVTAAPVLPALGISKVHTGNFVQGQTNASYTVSVSNAVGAATTSGTVTVTETVPSGLSLVSMAGTGWSCSSATCIRSDGLAGGSSYPAITVTVNVLSTATSPQVNAVSVSGGGGAAANTTDSTIINPVPVLTTIAPSTTPANSGPLTITANGSNFVSGAALKWSFPGSSSVTLPATFINAAQLQATLPANLLTTAGTAQVAVSNPGNVLSSAVSFVITPPVAPMLMTLAPNAAAVNSAAQALTANGSNFVNGAVIKWTAPSGGLVDLPASFISSAQLQATIPANLLTTAGTAQAAVQNPGGFTSTSLPFVVYPISTPQLSSLSPNAGTVNSGPVTLTTNGSNFISGASIQWTTPGGSALSLPASFINAAQLQATLPANFFTTAGTAQVAIVNPGNQLSTSLPFVITSTVVPPVGVSGVGPNSGVGATQAFTGIYSAAGSYQNLRWVQMLFATAPDGGGQPYCFVHYDVQGNGFWLYGDGGFFVGPVTPGTPSNRLQNSFCAVNTSASSVSGIGTNLTVNANIVFKGAGARNIYMRAQNQANVDTNWIQQGTWTSSAAALGTMSLSPASGTASTQTFTLTYPDPPGFAGAAFGWVQFLVGAASNGGGQPFCFLHYDRAGNGLWMYSSDVGFFLGPVTPGTASNLLNSSACSVNTAASSVTNTGGNLVVAVPIVMKAPMFGAKLTFQRTLDVLNRDTGWQQSGTWIVP